MDGFCSEEEEDYRAISVQVVTEIYDNIKALVSAEFLICREVLSETETQIQDELELWMSTNQFL